MTAADVRLHLRYSAWASKKLLDAVREMPIEAAEQNTGVSHGSLLGTLSHILMADWIWSTRVIEPMERPPATLEALETIWPQVLDKWIAWADALSDSDVERVISYHAMDGTPFQTPLWQIALHVVNHATLHRGQVMAMLRQAGVKPPGTDLIYYYRELDAAAKAHA